VVDAADDAVPPAGPRSVRTADPFPWPFFYLVFATSMEKNDVWDNKGTTMGNARSLAVGAALRRPASRRTCRSFEGRMTADRRFGG
jgi:hypothetical protein